MEKIEIRTNKREELLDITRLVNATVQQNNWISGALVVYCPHTTGAITVNEAADPSVASDMSNYLGRMIPQSYPDFRHSEGNSDAHIKSSLIGPSLTLIVEDGLVQLGTWQGVYFFEGDGPRTRSIWLQFLAA